MSSDLNSVLQLLQMNNYATIALITAVGYDYILTFAREINYVWSRPWSWVSTMFVLVRYLGLCWVLTIGLAGSTFVPGPVKAYAPNLHKQRRNADVRIGVSTPFHNPPLHNINLSNGYSKGIVIFAMSDWTFCVFFAAAEMVMVLRVYAMWNRSKTILAALLFIYVVEVVADFIVVGMYDNPNTYLSATVVWVNNSGFCNYSVNTNTRFKVYYGIPRYVLGTGLLILALIKTLSESVAMYKATKQWQPNRYLKLLIKDGILYFLLNILFNIFGEIENDPTINSTSLVFLAALSDILLCPVVPRFIISVREMYDHDLHRGLQGIDTGFGIVSQPNISRDAGLPAIAFADVAPGEDSAVEAGADGPLETTQLEVIEHGPRQA